MFISFMCKARVKQEVMLTENRDYPSGRNSTNPIHHNNNINNNHHSAV